MTGLEPIMRNGIALHPITFFDNLHLVSCQSVGITVDPLNVQTQNLTVSDNDQLLPSSESTNAQYSSDGVFSFDSTHAYSQHPVLVSTVIEQPYPGFVRHDTPFIQHVISEMEEEKVEIIDSSLQALLVRVKTEAELSEVEYGKLLKQIECGKVKNVSELVDSCLAM